MKSSVAGLKKSGFPRLLILPLAFVVVCMLVGGGWFYLSHGRVMKRDAEQNLLAIAQLKADQIVQWRAERLGDAHVITGNPFLADAASRWKRTSEAPLTEDLLVRFRSLKENYGYSDVSLVDPAGQVCLSLSGCRGPLTEDDEKALADALRERRPVPTDLHGGPSDSKIHIDVIAPLFSRGGDAAEPVGAIMLRSDARQFLFPLIQSWPTTSRTAEILLVRREDDSVLFLNELRHQNNTALKLRIPLSREDVPAVMAVLGKEGIVRGKDYRGIPVLAVLKPVPGSAWFMVAKVDEREAMANWRIRSMLLILLILSVLAFAAAGVLVVWQRNEKANYRAFFEAEAARRESEERFRTTVMSIGDGVITTDAAGRIEIMNPVAEAMTGWKQGEARLRPLEEVFRIVNEETRQKAENPVRRVVREGVVVGLANHTLLISRDGREYAVADCGAPIRDEAGEIVGVALVFRDQTAERASEKALRQSEEKYRSLAESSQDSIYLVDEKGRFLFANNMYLSRLGLGSEQVIGRPYDGFHPAEDADEFMEKLQQVLRTGQWLSYEHRSHRDNRLFLRTLSPVRGAAEDRTVAATVISKDITEYKQAEEKIRATLKEREVMLREIHHRVKNNIQIISSLLRLQAQYVRDGKVLEILNESQSRIRSMALIHEKLYQSQDFARIDFSDYIVKMITHLFAIFSLPSGRVRFRVEAEDIQLDINRAIPCGLIINELATNALKHAFPGERKGELIVRMNQEDGDHYRLSVKDNGVGLPEGFDPDKKVSLGFQIVRDLVKQLNGSIEFLGEEGTEIIIRF